MLVLVPVIASGGVVAATAGLLIGGAFLYVADQVLPADVLLQAALHSSGD